MNIIYDSIKGGSELTLTFNDGPHAVLTPQLLELLKQENIKAMFFVLGANAAKNNNIKIIKRAFEEGHIIGSHSYFHRNLKHLSDYEIRSEILFTEKLIKDFMTSPKLFRPPYGATNLKVNQIIWELGYVSVPWNIDSLDWKEKSAAWVENTISQISLREESVVLLHDTYNTTIDNMPELIKAIKHKKMHKELAAKP